MLRSFTEDIYHSFPNSSNPFRWLSSFLPPAPLILALISSALLGSIALYTIRLFTTTLAQPLPPGPKGTLLSGIKGQIPAIQSWLTYAKWSRKYGSILSFRIYNKRFIVLNSAEDIINLLDKRASIYSDRPLSWMMMKLCRREMTVFNISSLNERHKQYRRLIMAGLNGRSVQAYWPILESEGHSLLNDIQKTPTEFEAHIRRNATAVIMMVAFGYSVGNTKDNFVEAAEECAKITGWAMAPGRWLVEYLPIIRFIPSWMPGASFKRQADEWAKRLEYLSHVPHRWVKDQIASGRHVDSFTSKLLLPDEGPRPTVSEEDIIQWCASGLYAGASDTTVSALISFLMLMALHPDIQSQARREISLVTGGSRLPSYSELDRLEYLTAIMKEVLRFAPVAPLGLPHKVIQHDNYSGYHIPKNSVVIANVWAVMHDESLFSQPFVFDPQRFIKSGNDLSQPDPRKFSFGFGARTCPGSHFAEKTMLFNMASILSRFIISNPSRKRLSDIDFTTGITSHIKVFPCEFTAVVDHS